MMSVVVMAEITSTLSNLFCGSDEEKKEDMKKSEESQDTQTVAGDDGDASKEKVNRKGEKKSATDETATCSSDIAFIINHLHNDLIILSAADTTDSIKSLPSPAGEEATSTDKDTKDRLEL